MSKFLINRNALHNALSTTGKAISQSAIVPAFSNYLFQVELGKLTVSACNGETFISQHFPIESEIEILLQIPSKKLFEWISTLGDQMLIFTLGDNSTIEVKAGKDKCSFTWDNGEHFPTPQSDQPQEFTVDGANLMDGINKTIFAASATEQNESYANVCIELENSELSFTATNKTVFSTWSYPVGTDMVKTALVSPTSLAIVQSCMYGAPVSVSIGKMITFKLITGIVIKCSLIDLKFIEYKNLIQKTYDNVISCDRKDLIGSLKRSTIFSNDITKLVNIYVTPEQTKIVGRDDDLARDSESVLPCGGEEMEVCVNGNIFISCLSRIDTEEVFIEVRDYRSPLYIKTVNDTKAKKNFILLFPYVSL